MRKNQVLPKMLLQLKIKHHIPIFTQLKNTYTVTQFMQLKINYLLRY